MSSEASLPNRWVLAIHAGMTKLCIFMFCRRAQDHESLRGSSFGLTILINKGKNLTFYRGSGSNRSGATLD
jgi:hypothetical protein